MNSAGPTVGSSCPACGSALVREPDDYRREFRLALVWLFVIYATFKYILGLAWKLTDLISKVGLPTGESYSALQKLVHFFNPYYYLIPLVLALRIVLVLNAAYRPLSVRCTSCDEEHIETPGLTWGRFIRTIFTGVRRETMHGN